MTTPCSGIITHTDIQNEFGGSTPIRMSEYYGAASGIPTGPTIKMSDFYCKSSYVPGSVLPATTSVSSDCFTSWGAPCTAYAYIDLDPDGTYYETDSWLGSVTGNWHASAPLAGIGSNYQARATQGTISDAIWYTNTSWSTWVSLSVARRWGGQGPSPSNIGGFSYTLEIRDVATMTIQTTTTVTGSLIHSTWD